MGLYLDEDIPVTVGLVIDNSGTMGPKRPEVIAAAPAFARSSNIEDQMFVVNFNENVSYNIRNQHSIACIPTSIKQDGSFRIIRVMTGERDGRRLSVNTRTGYYAPPGISIPADERATS